MLEAVHPSLPPALAVSRTADRKAGGLTFLLPLAWGSSGLVGAIPAAMCDVETTSLDLSVNSLMGTVPPCMLAHGAPHRVNLGGAARCSPP
jgi:hypothetical protein